MPDLMIRVDSHQHVWRLSRNDYHWLTPEMGPIYHDFLPSDIEPLLKQCQLDGSILVQAAPTLEETYFLLQLARQFPFILGVVGWVELTAKNTPDTLAKLAEAEPCLRGIRPMIQDIDDVDWMLQKKLTPHLNALAALNLTFDALVLPKHLPNLNILLDRHPNLRVVIDHAAKPPIATGQMEPWASDLKLIALHPNTYCKLSGLLTEAGPKPSWKQLEPYVEHLVACFGVNRMMWGSDFPVLNLVSNYKVWYDMCMAYISPLGNEAKECVFGNVAKQAYALHTKSS